MILILSFYCKVMTFQSLESLIYIHKLGQREVKLKCYSPVKEYNLAYSLSSIEVEQPGFTDQYFSKKASYLWSISQL